MEKNLYVVHSIGLSETDAYVAWTDTVARLKEQCGTSFDTETGKLTDADGNVCYEAHRYLHNLFEYQRAADLLVCRAGAGSMSEAMALGIPTLLVPKRGLPGDHQELNAINVAEQQAAEVLFERHDPETGTDLVNGEELLDTIRMLRENEARRLEMVDACARLRHPGTDDRIADTIETILSGGEIDGESQIVEPRFVRFQRTFDNLITFLDHNARQSRNNLYVRLYNLKVEEYLAGRNMLVVNKGIKLIGSLRRADLYPYIYENFHTFAGYLKRNALAALVKADQFQDAMADMVEKGLNDRYFETRREAIRLYIRFHERLADRPYLQERILRLLNRTVESFEVKCAAIEAAVRFLDADTFMNVTEPYLYARNVRYREALLHAIRDGIRLGLFPDREVVRRFLRQMLITTSQFQPTFVVRQTYVNTLKKLEEKTDDQAAG